MVYLSAPTSQYDTGSTYCSAYRDILAKRRRGSANSPSAVVILAALEVDALCACRMLASLLTKDCVLHRIEPISGYPALIQMKDQLQHSAELHTLILLNIGSMLDLASEDWFGEFSPQVKVHVIDSRRPQSLPNLFGLGERAERIVVWDDGEVHRLVEERKAFEATMFDPSDSEDDSDDEDEDDEEEDEDDEDGPPRQKRRLNRDGPSRRERREQRDLHVARLDKYYMSGTHYGQSAAGIIYVLATGLERADNALLWLAILGLTYQYTTSRIPRSQYDLFRNIFSDEVARLNAASDAPNKALSADDTSIRSSDEMRFMLFRHWNLYDAMYHSAYVMNRLKAWNEKGRKQLQGMLAKIGFSLQQCQQAYVHMDMELKRELREKMDNYAPEYALVELVYPSFTRAFGYRLQPLCAADVVEGVTALLEAAGGVKLEVESEGGRGGGEWFGGSKTWSLGLRVEEKENTPPAGAGNAVFEEAKRRQREAGEDDGGEKEGVEDGWWVTNFWAAYDALGMNITLLRSSLPLAMALQRAIVREGTSLISKRAISQTASFRMATIKEGPDVALFAHPSTLSRLAVWLVDATRDWLPSMSVGRRKKVLPFVVSCYKEASETYLVVGVTGAQQFGDVRPNTFNLAFLEARDRSGARTRQATFDTSVVEVNKEDLHKFLETLAMRAG